MGKELRAGPVPKSREHHEPSLALRERIGRLEWSEVRVLNVEDHAPARFLRTRTLEHAGYTITEAESCKEALACAASDPLIKLALLDIGLPDGDGFRLCKRLKSLRPDVPVAMITSIYRSASAKQQGEDLGAEEYLLEPVPGPRLVRALDRLLTRTPAGHDPLPVVTTDAYGLIVGMNAAACELLNLSGRAAVGRSLVKHIGAERNTFADGLRLAASGQVVQDDWVLRPRERKARKVEIQIEGLADGTDCLECRIRPL